MPRPNVVLIMPDQQRADALGCAGDPVLRTPNIDALAADGVRFTRAYCQSPLCQPSRASFLTGRYPREHGVRRNEREFPPPSAPTFLKQLQRAGYHTAEVGKVHIGVVPRDTPRVPYLREYGFDHMHEVYGKMAYLRAGGDYAEALRGAGALEAFRRDMVERLAKMGPNATEVLLTPEMLEGVTPRDPWYAAPAPVPEELYMDNWVGDLAVDWINRYERDEPFFLWVGFCGPHDPHDAPQSFADPYLERLEAIPLGSAAPPEDTPSELYNNLLNWVRRYSGTGRITTHDLKRLKAFYYANITLIDRRVGDIVGALRAKGVLEDTWIVYTSDHGELAGDHQTLSKMLMYDGAMRVPMIVRPPGGCTRRVVDDLVELNDGAATVVDAAGAEQTPGSHARSLLPYIDGREAPRDRVGCDIFQFHGGVTERYTFAREAQSGTPAVLFDNAEDPQQDVNLAGKVALPG